MALGLSLFPLPRTALPLPLPFFGVNSISSDPLDGSLPTDHSDPVVALLPVFVLTILRARPFVLSHVLPRAAATEEMLSSSSSLEDDADSESFIFFFIGFVFALCFASLCFSPFFAIVGSTPNRLAFGLVRGRVITACESTTALRYGISSSNEIKQTTKPSKQNKKQKPKNRKLKARHTSIANTRFARPC
jgi:hypothetical protein